MFPEIIILSLLVIGTVILVLASQGVTTHEFGRHSFVSQGLAKGLTNEQIALVTNNLANIAAYSHMNIEGMRKIINLL
jgi:hypothetical protein